MVSSSDSDSYKAFLIKDSGKCPLFLKFQQFRNGLHYLFYCLVELANDDLSSQDLLCIFWFLTAVQTLYFLMPYSKYVYIPRNHLSTQWCVFYFHLIVGSYFWRSFLFCDISFIFLYFIYILVSYMSFGNRNENFKESLFQAIFMVYTHNSKLKKHSVLQYELTFKSALHFFLKWYKNHNVTYIIWKGISIYSDA